MIRILLVEDHEDTRQEMKSIIDGQEDLTVVEEAGSGEEAILAADRTLLDITLMDIALPGINGVEAMKAILAKHPTIKVLALSNFSGQSLIQSVRDAGGLGYVRKDRAFDELIPAIRKVVAGHLSFGEARPRQG